MNGGAGSPSSAPAIAPAPPPSRPSPRSPRAPRAVAPAREFSHPRLPSSRHGGACAPHPAARPGARRVRLGAGEREPAARGAAGVAAARRAARRPARRARRAPDLPRAGTETTAQRGATRVVLRPRERLLELYDGRPPDRLRPGRRRPDPRRLRRRGLRVRGRHRGRRRADLPRPPGARARAPLRAPRRPVRHGDRQPPPPHVRHPGRPQPALGAERRRAAHAARAPSDAAPAGRGRRRRAHGARLRQRGRMASFRSSTARRRAHPPRRRSPRSPGASARRSRPTPRR